MIAVTGPPGCGTRLMVRILEAGGHAAFHDQGHALHTDLSAFERVVAMRRDRSMAEASVLDYLGEQGVDGFPYDECVAAVPGGAIWVDYEAVVADPLREIDRLSSWLKVDSWPIDFTVYDANARRIRRSQG